MFLGVIIVLVIAVLLYIYNTQRQLVNLDELCKNAMSQIAVQLNSRWDAVLALAKMASKYAKHESETIINTINARRQGQVTTADQVNAQQGELSQIMGRLMAIGEAYPELKANDLYINAQNGVNQYEENRGTYKNRYDVTILVNGLPMVHIELKKRGVCHINFSPWGMITMQTDGTKWIVWQDFNPDMDPFIQRYLKSHPWLIV